MNNETEISEKTLQLILERCEAATAGPWKSYVEGRDHESGSSFIKTACDDIELSGATSSDQDFIAHCRQDVALLVVEVRRLRRMLTNLES